MAGVEQITAALRGAGASAESRVMMVNKINVWSMASLLAVIRLGAVFVPVRPPLILWGKRKSNT